MAANDRKRPEVELARALAHPLRNKILDSIAAEGTSSPKRLAKKLGEDLSNVSYHVRVLRDLGFIRKVDDVPRHGAAEHIYELAPFPASRFLPRRKVPKSVRGHASAPVLQAIMDEGVAALKAGTLDARGDSHLSCGSAVLDAEGWEEVAGILAATEKQIVRAQGKCDRRLAKAGEEGTPVAIVLASFESARAKGSRNARGK